ncbi:hypothetical protein [Micromonospora sp. WMMD1082]|uniref:hypothetical protein n=1 Tax=Micromonospora sp. WMMD1082 TaxID=3016104 RepID=UPI002417D217|nr:hypothetical protein [Micromonospora sp. WMMD1082]MDG4797598.1 hypothetical protein [Micromonospora sp. WMMD1082]
MGLETDQDLLRDLAWPIVRATSPGEDEELFQLLAEAHFADPAGYANADHRSGPLAFGLPELVVLLTPVALAAMTEAVRYVVGVGVRRGHRVTADALRRLFRGKPAEPQTAPLELTVQEWTEVHRIVEQVARRGGFEPERATLVADAVVGRGMLGKESR